MPRKRAGEQKILAAKAELNQAKANKASDLAAIDAKINFLKLGVETAEAGVMRLDKLRAERRDGRGRGLREGQARSRRKPTPS